MGNCHKGKTSRCQRTVNILSHEWYFQRNNTLCCFPLVLKISKPNSNDETYYGNQASTVKSHLSSLWPNVTARVVLIFCHQVCWKRLMQPHLRKQRSVYLETAKWLAESPACLYLSDVDPGWCVGIVTEPVVQSIFLVQKVHYDKRAVNTQHPKLTPEGQHTELAFIFEGLSWFYDVWNMALSIMRSAHLHMCVTGFSQMWLCQFILLLVAL